ncbi:hypothetical protein M422DRAFT_262146 [Sphaerobolus stellatus SS14]|uniref:Unplaced genomic scaffold SPHSTscaffold_112, whole genome shotgun sequence n=1 Tax=Sphaerobolus stellatus (strain SS14) TaxID=990650 RepID=A0A0C9TYL6_SPHS4|nr:hypothetical protein M422DRAFT_262146 [Sphaerobolus stellatus SS14]
MRKSAGEQEARTVHTINSSSRSEVHTSQQVPMRAGLPPMHPIHELLPNIDPVEWFFGLGSQDMNFSAGPVTSRADRERERLVQEAENLDFQDEAFDAFSREMDTTMTNVMQQMDELGKS